LVAGRVESKILFNWMNRNSVAVTTQKSKRGLH
jgi:hypothetical protein